MMHNEENQGRNKSSKHSVETGSGLNKQPDNMGDHPGSEVQLEDGEQMVEPSALKKHQDKKDLISKLPDEILIQILALLPLEEATATSILSKRWEHLWAFVPDLHFGESYFSDPTVFLDFVERAYGLRHGYPVRAFGITCRANPHVARIKNIISSFLTCGVQKLNLILRNGDYQLPSSIFESATLERLHVRSRCIIRVPSLVRLPNLKVLNFEEVIFEDSDSVDKLCSCPSLERIEFNCCNWRGVKTVTVSAPRLRQLLIINFLWSSSYSPDIQVHITRPCLEMLNDGRGFLFEHCTTGETTHLPDGGLLIHPSNAERNIFGGRQHGLDGRMS